MKKRPSESLATFALVSTLLGTLGACSSGGGSDTSSNDGNDGERVSVGDGTAAGDSTPLAPRDPEPRDPDPRDPDTGDVATNEVPTTSNPPLPSSAGLPAARVADTTDLTGPLLTPTADDFFFSALERDPEPAVPGGAPTQPKNLRIDLVSNDWAEFSWAPSNDDGRVVEYLIRRDDGVTYSVRADQRDPRSGTQREIDRYWRTTSFIDCNYTRFAFVIHECATNGPSPGDTFSYDVIAIDDEGNRSIASAPIRIHYHEEIGAPVSDISDPYLGENLALSRDVTHTAHFLDRFDLVFEDEFDKGAIDTTLWQTELVWGDDLVINGEKQYFVSTQRENDPIANAYDPFAFGTDEDDGTLIIRAEPTPAGLVDELPAKCREADPSSADDRRCLFLSGALSSHDRFHMTYGYVESRMKVSGQRGALSSFYIQSRYEGQGRDYHAPEIDIVEYLGENPFGDEDAFQNYHYGDTALRVETGERLTRRSPTMAHENPEGDLYSDDFHTYGVLWEPQLVIWYIDGREVKRLSGPQVGRRAMNIVTYLVAGSGWAPTPDIDDPNLFPLELEIDWIRAWQRDGYRDNGLYPALERG